MIFGIPALDRRVVVLVEEQPLLALALRAPPHQHEPSFELRPIEIEVELTGVDGGDGVVAAGLLPCAPIPHDDIAAAVLTGRDASLEVEVIERVILDVHRQSLRVWIE